MLFMVKKYDVDRADIWPMGISAHGPFSPEKKETKNRSPKEKMISTNLKAVKLPKIL